LSKVPLRVEQITPEEILICETQGRMLFQVAPEDVDEVLAAIRSQNVKGEVIGEITGDNRAVFEYRGRTVAVIPNEPSPEQLQELLE
ncbi:MAG: phosphoribosylformylglycinamidine synthase subunit PurL, partial [Thermacetogenium sp.]|nr:phosphoribosylformylglycinamidine synthase subunit PurL [Thermacetogenium sp.]